MPKTKEQFEAMKMASVEKINETAVKLFAKRGLAGTNIRGIAKEAGISMGLMYHYYKSKEDLYAELVRFAVTSANELLARLMTEEIPAKEKIEFFTQHILDSLKDDNAPTPYYFALMNQALRNDGLPKTAEKYTKMAFESLHTLRAIIESGQATGEIKNGDAMSLAILYLSAQHGLCSFKLMAGDAFTPPNPAWVNEILINK